MTRIVECGEFVAMKPVSGADQVQNDWRNAKADEQSGVVLPKSKRRRS